MRSGWCVQIAPATDLRRCEDLIPIHKAYTLRRLADSNTSFDPFEHITVHDIFHPEVYACMLAHLPKPGANYGGTISKVWNRAAVLALYRPLTALKP
jgi:hypothetical protein